MVLGSPFFVATFVFLGRFIATRTVRTGIAITAMGIIGVAPLAVVSGIRLFMGAFTDYGIDATVLQQAFDAPSPWYLGFFLMNAAQFLAWIVAGVVILRTGVAPRWTGVCLILGVLSVVTGQGVYFALTLFSPLGIALWLAGIWGIQAATGT